MNKKLIAGVAVVLVAIAAFGLAFGTATGSAAEPAKQMPMMMNQMDPKAMAEQMKSPEMQKQCVEMMKNADMQQAMMGMMKQPEMQAIMKQMLQKDAGFHQMMLDLVNSVDMNMDHGNMQINKNTAPAPAASGHSSHHQ